MKISGFEQIISIEQFEYCCEVNSHEICRFVCYAKDKDVDSLLKLVDSDCSFEDDIFSFAGHISELTFSKDISGTKIEVFAIGGTYHYDEDVHNRIFQDSDKTLPDVLAKLKSMSDVKYNNKSPRAIHGILVQNRVTDWQFAIQLATMIGGYIFPGEKPFIAPYGEDTITLSEEDFIDYKYTVSRKKGHLFCRLNKNVKIGTVLNFKGKKMFVYKKKYVLEQEQYYLEYYLLETSEEKHDFLIDNEILLEATVKDNSDPDRLGRIKVSFASDSMEDCMEDKALLLERVCSFATKSFGIASIPAIDDKVLVKICNGRGIVIGSLRTEAYNEAVQDENGKYIVFADKVFLEYKDNVFTLINQNNKVSLNDERITINIGDKAQCAIETAKAALLINQSALELSNDFKAKAGNCLFEAQSKASLSASNVNIKGKGGVNIN